MNGKRIAILVVAFAVSALIVWRELPIEFPYIVVKILRLLIMFTVVLAVTIFAFIFSGGKKKSS
jgi:hypothetical protein